jgi:hypothetical protein
MLISGKNRSNNVFRFFTFEGLPGFVWVAFLCPSVNACHDPIFFCTPVHSSAQGMIVVTDNKPFRASQHSTLARGNGLGRVCLALLQHRSFLPNHACARTCSWDAGASGKARIYVVPKPSRGYFPLGGVRLDFAFPLRRVALTRKTRIAMLHIS